MPKRIRLNEKTVREAEPIKGKDYQYSTPRCGALPSASTDPAAGRLPLITAALGDNGG